jgi:hypothetical protein
LTGLTGFWPIFFLMVVLKIPVIASIWLVWWAAHQDVEQPEEAEDEGGNKRRKMPPKLPRGPRRGPHGGGVAEALPDCPPGGRTRVVRPAPNPAFARAGSRADTDRSRPRRYDA